ncbi:putative 60S ribosomal protein L12 [Corchorus olitorius]|uniref:60S ribosomal protein L12 n=1 Tax=Corchorus olitorius TaxID=93759 RepID=A0A1R3JNM9_9ROSI|nr:putative 60S ribosomal protein L12 [Corchorus olitorius]
MPPKFDPTEVAAASSLTPKIDPLALNGGDIDVGWQKGSGGTW